MSNYVQQATSKCCESCVRNKHEHTCEFLSTDAPYYDKARNCWVIVRYKCSNFHLFYTKELAENYNNRVEKHDKLKNKIKELKLQNSNLKKRSDVVTTYVEENTKLKERIKELESIIINSIKNNKN